MKILLIHNSYVNHGGEDTTVMNINKLLNRYSFTTRIYKEDNKTIKSIYDKIIVFFRSIYSFKSKKRFEKIVNEFQPSIIQVHNTFPLISTSILFSKKNKNIPIVCYLHNYRFICGSSLLKFSNSCCEKCGGNFFKAILKKCYRSSYIASFALALNNLLNRYFFKSWIKKVDTYVLMNKKNMKYYLQYGIPKEKIIHKYHFTFMDEKFISNEETYALYVGEFSKKKGLHTLLKAWDGINHKLKIIGRFKSNEPEIKELLKNSKSNVELLGEIKYSEIVKYYSRANVIIFPTEWNEPFGNVIMESFANSTPVITTNIEPIKEIATDGYNSLFFEKGNSEDLRRVIINFYANDDLKVKLSENAYQTYKEKFSPEKNIEDIRKIYSNAKMQKSVN